MEAVSPGRWQARKVAIVGAGSVGATFAYALALDGAADEIVLMDIDREQAEGQVLDLAHGMPYMPTVSFRVGDPSDYADAKVIVITAGAKQKPGETRLDLLKRNAAIIEQITADIVGQESIGVLVMVSNPVDLLTQVALEKSGWPRSRVLGSGTVLDSARFRYLLSQHCNVDVRNVHAYILGEHGDSEVAAWSMTHIAGMSMDRYCTICRKCENWTEERDSIAEQVRNSAYHIINYKGATFYAVGLALVRIVGSILRNERSVLTVSSFLEGEYGLHDVCLSVPCIVSQKGAEQIVESDLPPGEARLLADSAKILRDLYKALHEPEGG